ncbi:MAG: GTP cyclohydrolase II [Acetobacterales bacterium]
MSLPGQDSSGDRFPAAPGRDLLRTVDLALADLRRGGVVVVDGGPGRAALALAAETATGDALRRLRETAPGDAGVVMPRPRAAALGLAPEGLGPVILAPQAPLTAGTLRALADPAAHGPVDPAHWTVLTATGSESAEGTAMDLAKLARLMPVVVVVGLDTDVAPDAAEWAAARGLRWVRSAQVQDYAEAAARTLHPVAEAKVPLADAPDARVIAFRPGGGEVEHLAIVVGTLPEGEPPLVRLHSECFTGDVLASLRCDCGEQLRGALRIMSEAGGGILVYLAQEGRGIGLVNKLRAYALQDEGVDTFDANELLGFGPDDRLYLPAAEILRHLGVDAVRLLSNNPEKAEALAECGIEVVDRVPHAFPANGHNDFYLMTKARRQGHRIG